MALIYRHHYPTEHDAPEMIFYFAAWLVLAILLNWNLSYSLGLMGFHPVLAGLIALFLAYATVFLNKLGTP